MTQTPNIKTAAPGDDPTPWRHVDGSRVADIHAPGSRMGGYTFDPRAGYANHDARFVSKRTA